MVYRKYIYTILFSHKVEPDYLALGSVFAADYYTAWGKVLKLAKEHGDIFEVFVRLASAKEFTTHNLTQFYLT